MVLTVDCAVMAVRILGFQLDHSSATPGHSVGHPEVIRFIRHAARWRRFFRCSLAASNFRSHSA